MCNRQADNPFQTTSNQESITPEVIHYPKLHRFQININGLEAGYISYTEHNGGQDVDHTEISPDFRYRSIAKLLVDALMEYAETHHIPLTVSCDYVARFIGRLF